MTFPSPPRGHGPRHALRDDRAGGGSDFPTDPTMPAPLNRVPRRDVRRGDRPAMRQPTVDVVVPRVFVEPDELMDKLRARALRWGIARDVLLVAVAVFLLASWAGPTVARWLGIG